MSLYKPPQELKTTYVINEEQGIYLEFVQVVKDRHDSRGQVINQEVVGNYVQGEGVPDEILKAYAEWWRDGFPEPTPEKIEQYLHSVSAGHLLNFF